jgi:hypothetical protein
VPEFYLRSIRKWRKEEMPTEANNLPEIPSIPVVVKGLMTSTWTHFPDTGAEDIGVSPGCFDFFTTSPPNTIHKAEVKVSLAVKSVSINVPARDPDINVCIRVNLHVVGKFLHSACKIFRVLTPDVVREDYTWELDTSKSR